MVAYANILADKTKRIKNNAIFSLFKSKGIYMLTTERCIFWLHKNYIICEADIALPASQFHSESIYTVTTILISSTIA